MTKSIPNLIQDYPEDSQKMTWDAAKKYCEDLGTGWYFPSKEEVKIMRSNLLEAIFALWYFWSSTEDVNNVNNAWITSPKNGLKQWTSSKSDEIYTRAIRTF